VSTIELTGLARIPLLILERTADYGLDRNELAAAAGFKGELQDPDARVSVTKIWNLWRIFIDRTSDPILGLHLGMGVGMRQFGLVGYAMLNSRTVLDALGRMTRYSRIMNEALEVSLSADARRVDIVVAPSTRLDALVHPVDARLGAVVTATRSLSGAEIAPIEVRFPYRRPHRVSEHRRFFRCEMRFDCTGSGVAFRRQDLDRPVASADETLVGYLDHYAEAVLESLAKHGSYAERVRKTLWSQLADGPPTLGQAASALGVSVRTLQRRLSLERTSFASVLDEFRRAMAVSLLRDRSLAVYEVAFLLGYGDPSTFYRAFRRWEGVPPHEFRKTAS
jgi:AraC-like DNA-binding protein